MNHRRSAALVLAIAVLLATVPARAEREVLSKTEAKCQQAAAKEVAKVLVKRTGCISKCEKKTPQSAECLPPYSGKTRACVQKIDDKVQATLSTKCVSDGTAADSCPECYENALGSCADAIDSVDLLDQAIDQLVDQIFCDDSGSADQLSKVESKCRQTLAAALAKMAATADGCYAKCVKAEAKGKTDGSCDPPAADTKTAACLTKALDKAQNAITKKCADKPDCMSNPLVFVIATAGAINGTASVLGVCPVCGDGLTEGGEDCDPPGATTCPAAQACTAHCTCPSV